MTRKLMYTAMLATLALAGCAATAGPMGGRQCNIDRKPPCAAEMFKRMDTNHDGAISKSEFLAMPAARFATADANKDGKLTQAEFEKMPRPMMRPHGKGPRGMMMDGNGPRQ